MRALEFAVPGDKSIAHRAFILGALANGESRVTNLPAGADVASTLVMMRAFGADIVRDGARAIVRGRGVRSLRAPTEPIDCGNSGTSARLGFGIAATLPGKTTFTGDASLRARPIERVAAPLREMGAHVEYLDAADRLPARVTGGTLADAHFDSELASAQVKSAILVAAVAAGVGARLRVPTSRDHTERMLVAMGAALRVAGPSIELESSDALAPVDIEIPGDVSSAAFLMAGALLAGTPIVVRDVGVNPTRTGFLDVLARMGAPVELRNARERGNEPVADVVVQPADLRGTRIGGDDIVRTIDELPLVAILAAHAEGETIVADATELRAKECDRIRALCANLGALGVDVEERADGFAVRGSRRPLAGTVESFGDHRIAMAFSVLALRPGSRIVVDDPGVAHVSYPEFDDHMERLRAAKPASLGGAA